MKTWAAMWLLVLATACGSTKEPATAQADATAADSTADAGPSAPEDFDKPGPYGVGVTTVTATDPARNRLLTFTIWYPTAIAIDKGRSPETFYTGAQADALHVLLASAPTCTTTVRHDLGEAPPLATPATFPLVAFSHCHSCFRTSSFHLAQHLASHGIAVIAPDHTGNTLFDKLESKLEGLSQAMLATRVADVRFALDVALDPASTALPAALRGRMDPKRVGVFGHSFGGVTAGQVLQDDPRVLAGLAIAVPMENPVLPGATMAAIHKPVLLILAREDNSILESGNAFIRQNFADANPPAWLVQVADAGHFSFSDIAGLVPEFAAGCGAGKRQTDDTAFTYLDNARGQRIASHYITAFFHRFLMADSAAQLALDGTPTDAAVTVQAK
jgi:predicted dienelactone hydrolase